MPNGNQDFHEQELPALEAFFAPMADALIEFGSRHNLLLTRYYHQFPWWSFSFRHPRGGVGCVSVMKESEDSIKVYSNWWIDDFDLFTRSARKDETPTIDVKSPDLGDVLTERLKAILSWEPGDWTEVHTGYERIWKHVDRKQREREVEQYPIPEVFMKSNPGVLQIPLVGGSGNAPTGAVQFQDDWPGLFMRGDDAILACGAIRLLQERLADHHDIFIATALHRLGKLADVIERDVMSRGQSSDSEPKV
jgi:hypothetical protein